MPQRYSSIHSVRQKDSLSGNILKSVALFFFAFPVYIWNSLVFFFCRSLHLIFCLFVCFYVTKPSSSSQNLFFLLSWEHFCFYLRAVSDTDGSLLWVGSGVTDGLWSEVEPTESTRRARFPFSLLRLSSLALYSHHFHGCCNWRPVSRKWAVLGVQYSVYLLCLMKEFLCFGKTDIHRWCWT